MPAPAPTEITLHQKSHALEIAFDDGKRFRWSHEFLRVYSPSAAVRGHGPGQEVLQIGKEEVRILKIVPVGNYALRFVFSDGHDTGIYPWEMLHKYGMKQDVLWQEYLQRLQNAGIEHKARATAEIKA